MEQSNTNYHPIINFDRPDTSKTYAVRAVCFDLNGEITDMVMTIPGHTTMFEAMEVAAVKLEETLKYLTSRFAAFRAYQIQIGHIDKSGVFNAQHKQPVKQIPIREEWSGHFVNAYAATDKKEVKFLKDHV